MISSGSPSITFDEVFSVTTEAELAYHYLGIKKIPCRISSPLRQDKTPSFGVFSPDGNAVTCIDFSTGERWRIVTLLSQMWGTAMPETLSRIWKDLHELGNSPIFRKTKAVSKTHYTSDVLLKCKVRDWKKHDIEYWSSYGVPLKWLKFANVYPISHKIIHKNNQDMVFGADKYAYAYVEFKDNRCTIKIYQPFNKNGFKWTSGHDGSVISLWSKLPEIGERVCICSSLKDALCLWANTGIPSIAVQGEGYKISSTARDELLGRFRKVYILFDNDEAGLVNAEKLSRITGFTNIVLPRVNNNKDVSDLMKNEGKDVFLQTILPLFKP